MPAGRARQPMNTAPAPARIAAQRLSREEIVAAAVAARGPGTESMRSACAASLLLWGPGPCRCTGTWPAASSCWI